jgi:hypothetical protein
MRDELVTSIVTILTAVIGVAILAVLVSRNAQTGQVIQAAGQSFGSVLGVALSPITGQSNNGGFASLGTNFGY